VKENKAKSQKRDVEGNKSDCVVSEGLTRFMLQLWILCGAECWHDDLTKVWHGIPMFGRSWELRFRNKGVFKHYVSTK